MIFAKAKNFLDPKGISISYQYFHAESLVWAMNSMHNYMPLREGHAELSANVVLQFSKLPQNAVKIG